MADPPLEFHPLSFVPERGEDEVLVGRPDSESFAVFATEDAALLQRMSEGIPPAEAAAWYEETYGQAVDIADFLMTLAELGFLREEGAESVSAGPVRFQRLGRIVFSPATLGALVVVVTCWIFVIARHPDLAPNPRQVFFTGSVVLVQLLVVFGQLPWIGLHEGSHVLAGRRLGLPSTLGIGTRLYFVVFETRMNGLLTVPRRQRYLPILAGMLVDLFVISTLSLIAFALRGPAGSEPLAGRLALAIAFPILVRLFYQLLLFLRTDVYFVVANALGCHDLHAAAQALIQNWAWRLLRRSDRLIDQEQWTERDRRAARWYAPFFVLGGAVMIAIGVLVVVPILDHLAHLVWQGLTSSPSGGHFWDSLLFSILNLAQFAAFAFIATRDRLRRRRAARPA
jgi:hypothetical protein